MSRQNGGRTLAFVFFILLTALLLFVAAKLSLGDELPKIPKVPDKELAYAPECQISGYSILDAETGRAGLAYMVRVKVRYRPATKKQKPREPWAVYLPGRWKKRSEAYAACDAFIEQVNGKEGE